MITSSQSIREIVTAQSSATAVLERFGIDPCSQASESLEQICAELQLSIDQVLEKLFDAAAQEPGMAAAQLASYSLSRLIQHIVRTHHQCVRRELPRLVAMAHKLTGEHGDRIPELKKIEQILDELNVEMFAYLQKEEQVLFPLMAEMDQNSASISPASAYPRSLAQPVATMVIEHGLAENMMAEIHDLTSGFEAPGWACLTHITLYAGLREFAGDLRQHVHLENDLLFPRAIKMEAELRRMARDQRRAPIRRRPSINQRDDIDRLTGDRF